VEHLKIAFYLLVLLVGAAATTYVFMMARTHRLPFLKPYAWFLTLANLLASINLTLAYASANLLRFNGSYQDAVLTRLLGPISRLTQVGIVYALLAIAAGFCGCRLSRRFNVISGLFAGVLLISYVVVGALSDASALRFWIAGIQLAVFYLAALTIVGSFFYIFFHSWKNPNAAERKAVRAFAASYLSMYSVFAVSYLLPVGSKFFPNAFALLAINIIPFIWLKKFFAEAYLAAPPSTEDRKAFERFCENHGLTSREAGVLELILKGKSNADIGKDLFISPHTVKNHITNIYGKLGVRSRWQLISLFQSDRTKQL
jgi:DNA-binding CsgD family transcriptional regulator